jgi:hypothetical protein
VASSRLRSTSRQATSTNTGLWQYNLRTGDLWATEQCRAMFGLTPKTELKPKIFLRAVHRDDRSIIAAAIRLIRYGAADAKSVEFRILHPNRPNALDSRRKQNPPR